MADLGPATVLSTYESGTLVGLSSGFASDAEIQPDQGVLVLEQLSSSPFGDDGPVPAPITPTNAGIPATPEETEYPDWFERVHIVPREEIAFGNILAPVDEDYEIFNSYRSSDVNLIAIANGASPGVEFPNLGSLPVTIGPLASILDPTSTYNPPVPVADTIRALRDGLPSFDTSIIFTFDDGSLLTLFVSGQRISVFPFEFDLGRKGEFRETLSFLTDIIQSQNGKEQRIALRKQPRQLIEVSLRLDGTERQRFNSLMFGWQSKIFGLPFWLEQSYLSSAASISDTVLSVGNVSDSDFRVGGFVIVFQDQIVYDIAAISSLTSTTITISTPLVNGYAAGSIVAPVRLVRSTRTINSGRYANNLERFDVAFEVVDNTTGALTESTSGLSTYDGKILFDDCNVMEQALMQQTLVQRIHVVDNETGVVYQESPWDRNKRTSAKGFFLQSKAEIKQFRQRILALQGRQKSFWIPTFFNDLTVVATLNSGSNTMDIEHIGYDRFVDSKERMRTVKVTFTDGTSQVNEVSSVVEVSSTVERLTMADNWSTTKTVSEIERVEFYELSRLDSDDITIVYQRIGLAKCVIPIITVFDNI